MEEHIFGTYATDRLKVVHHRTVRRGLQHAHALTPRDPLPGDAVTVTVRVGADFTASGVALYYTLDGSLPAGSRGAARSGQAIPLTRAATEWDTLVWGYVETWQGVIPAQAEGTVVRYCISAWHAQDEIYADWPDAQDVAERAADAFFKKLPEPVTPPGDPLEATVFTYHVDRLAPPQWAREAIIYQIFPDRFNPGDGRGWQTPDPATQINAYDGVHGGTLWGVAEKLDYIADLGATALWLTPIFPSPTYHGYDATDYMRVADHLGGDDALRAVVQGAHARGMRVILDLVCNHVSHLHPIFLEAQADPASPYREWFTFDESETGYRSFFGVKQMPQLNLTHPAARAWMLDIARYWLREFDVDGYRLDYAHGPGPDFWADFWAACKQEKPDCFCFGETVDMPEVLITYAGRLDGTLDFEAQEALRRTFGSGDWPQAQFERFVARHRAYFPDNFILPTFLDNHDTNRFLYIVAGDVAKLKRAAAAQFALPGPPIIYYGTEIGLSQTHSAQDIGLDAARPCMVWDEDQWDHDLLAFYKNLIRARRRF